MPANPSDIFPALRKAYLGAGIADAETLTSFPNERFDPKGKDVWYGLHFIPNRPEVFTLGTGGLNRADGLLQVDINLPLNSGMTGLKAFSAALCSAFTAGAKFSHDTAVVNIRGCGQSGNGFPSDSWFRIPFQIEWEAFPSR